MSSPSIVPGQAVPLSPRVRRVTQNNPGLMTGPGTNTYLIGRHTLFVLDPGEDTDEHFDTVMRLIGSTPVRGGPQSRSSRSLAHGAAPGTGARGATFGYKPHNGYEPAHLVREGDVIGDEDWSLRSCTLPDILATMFPIFSVRSALFSQEIMSWAGPPRSSRVRTET